MSFTVEAGTIVGLIGPNGAGKTTLFNCISGLYPVTAGRIFFAGAEITGLPSYRIARMGAVRTFQVVRPAQGHDGVRQRAGRARFCTAPMARRARDTAENCIQICNLTEYADKSAGGLPIGGKKRLELARALATRPRLLMLDEVMAGLTSTEIKAALEIIRRIVKKASRC